MSGSLSKPEGSLHEKVQQALTVLAALGLPRAQQNERSALCLLALLDLSPARAWASASAPLRGITPIMDWVRDHYGKVWKPNTRETVRRQTMHQFCDAGLAIYNPDDPARSVNSPHAVYQIAPEALVLLQQYATLDWQSALATYLSAKPSLVARYASERQMLLVPVTLAPGQTIQLSPGQHSALIRAIIEDFAPRWVPGGEVVYVGDTGEKFAFVSRERLAALGVTFDDHGKMPDVVLHDRARGWLVLVESVTSHGPVDAKRHAELALLFRGLKAGLVYVTAFPSRKLMAKYLPEIAWETEVWCAESPTHLIHFNGERYLGPYQATATS
jgi:hypothetical protein